MKLRRLPASLPFLTLPLLALPLLAAETAQPEIVVTASRTAETADATLAPVTVFTRRDIEASQAQSLPDLLRTVPGATLASYGGVGKTTSLFLRGTESDHVLVLVDGLKLGSATAGSAALQDIPLDRIERIEVVRGPRAALYGSEAIGGVIQVFTRGARGNHFSASLGGGSEHSARADAQIGFGDADGWLSFGAGHFETRGDNSCRPFLAGGCYTNEPDDDGYRNDNGSIRGGYRFGPAVAIEAQWLKAVSDNDYDGDYQNGSHNVQEALGATLKLGDGGLRGELTAGRSEDKSDNAKDGVHASRFDTRRDTLSAQAEAALGRGQHLTFGADYLKDEVDSDTAYTRSERDNLGLFGQYRGEFGAHALQLALRSDDNEQFGRHATGSLAWGWQLNDALRLVASYGTAFKAPSFNDLYYPGFSNPDLDPERSKSAEIGLRYDGLGRLAVNLFQTRVDELIGYDSAFNVVNIDEARITGAEIEYAWRGDGWQLRQNLSWLDPENRSQANHGKLLARRAKQVANTDLSAGFGDFELGGTLHAEGKRYDDAGNNQRLGGYATLDLRAAYRFAKQWQLQARVGNVFDKQYETAAYYVQQGRNFFVTLRYQH